MATARSLSMRRLAAATWARKTPRCPSWSAATVRLQLRAAVAGPHGRDGPIAARVDRANDEAGQPDPGKRHESGRLQGAGICGKDRLGSAENPRSGFRCGGGAWRLSNLGPKMIAGDFRPGFMIKLQHKDLRLAIAAAKKPALTCRVLIWSINSLIAACEKDGATKELRRYSQRSAKMRNAPVVSVESRCCQPAVQQFTIRQGPSTMRADEHAPQFHRRRGCL